MKSLLLGIATAVELNVQAPPAIRGASGSISCDFSLADGENFSSLQVYKNEKSDSNNHFAVIKSLSESTENWLGSDRLSLQINQNESGSQSVTLSVNDVTDSDKGTYFCELDFSTQSSPLEITKTAQSDLDVYYPPTTVNLSTKMADNGVIEITCTADEAYPATSIGVNIDAVTEADVPQGKLFTYALSPVDNSKDITCTATHVALSDPLTQSVTLVGPSLPAEGDLVEELTLGDTSLNNNAKLVAGITSTSGALNLISADFSTANGTCQVSLKADAGNAFPAVDYTWFVDSEKKAEGQICDFEVNALDNINTVATVIANSPLGKSALQYDFGEACFPTPTTTTVSLVESPKEAENGPGQFSVDEPVDEVSTAESELHENSTLDSIMAFNLTDENDLEEASMGGPIIAAIAAGSFFGLVLIGVALYFLCFKKPDGESYRTNDKSHLDDEVASLVDELTASNNSFLDKLTESNQAD